jgi:hypothetical protein
VDGAVGIRIVTADRACRDIGRQEPAERRVDGRNPVDRAGDRLADGDAGPFAVRAWLAGAAADLNVDQSAAVLGCSPGTVKSQTARALDSVHRALGPDPPVPAARPRRPRSTRFTREGAAMIEQQIRDLFAETADGEPAAPAQVDLQAAHRRGRARLRWRRAGLAGACALVMAVVATLVVVVPGRETINGYHLVLKRGHAGGSIPAQEVCGAHAGGLWFDLEEFGSRPVIGVTRLFRDHVQLLGPNPAHWTQNPSAERAV